VRKRLKLSTGKLQSVHTVTCAICGYRLALVTVNSVVVPVPSGAAVSTSK